MTSSGGFTGIDVSDDDNVNVSLFLSHFEGFLSVQKKRKKIERNGMWWYGRKREKKNREKK
jgi:hypothetical protein